MHIPPLMVFKEGKTVDIQKDKSLSKHWVMQDETSLKMNHRECFVDSLVVFSFF